MLGYVTLGTNDIQRGAEFYDKICAEFGVGRMMEDENFIAWATPGGGCGFGLTKPFDGEAASVGNGVMIAFQAKDREQVDKVYNLAIELGAQDEGAAGPRGDGSFYAGYFRDPDGHKCNVFCMG